jgi:serine protease inhibitor
MKRILGGALLCLAAFVAMADDMNLPKLAAANNGFAFDLLRQIAKDQPAGNIFISPYSVSTVLQMLGNGAAGKTKAEMQRVLKTDDLPPGDLNSACKVLDQSLMSQPDVTLDLANSIWFKTGLELKPRFVSTNKEFFNAEMDSVNFETPESADTINTWAKKNTRGKITDVVSFPFPALTRVVLANAIYFKSKWATPFDESLTKPRYFYLVHGIIKETPMMSQHRKFWYEETGDFQAVELPYAGDHLQMVLFLPAANSSPRKLLEQFNGKSWNYDILQGVSEREGTLTFPKFKLDYDVDLNAPLQDLGMKLAFIPDVADFSGIADDGLFVSEVKQKSFVDVNEEGTEAAAVTTVMVGSAAIIANRPPPFQMIVDRPFFFVIVDNATDTILFMGIVNDPTL